MSDRNPAGEEWARLKPDTVIAVKELSRKLESATANRELVDAYLYAKRLLAEAMRAFVLMELPERCDEFRRGRADIGAEMKRRYAGRVPDAYLEVPYKSRVHEALFCVLHRDIGDEVPGSLLRTVTADSVHTERRVRELRELGFPIASSESEGIDFYKLESAVPDFSMIPSLIMKVGKRNKFKAMPERELKQLLGISP
ncbi:hypothetical protein [Actinomadura bangladeshensis]|uniref:Uncharacterized protein n=1 Tax=Actinomadura bangladeshensis TaxID=453573 RepID=A0A6L9QN33_9ACTN|nr:hypothetical protein [Actinomadura bangladeshensis]NEA26847.1 hypothetical protein [Actinomadura bangladeshensis]